MGRCTLRSFFTPETLKTAGLLMAPLVVGSLAALGVFLKMDADFSTYFSALRRRTKSYQDKVVWVIGASSGIGEYYAREVAKQGAIVVLSARREDELKRVKDSLGEGVKCLVLPLDVTKTSSHQAAAQKVVDTYGKIDVVVLNAGRTQRSVVWETPQDTVRNIMELNFLSVVYLTQAVLPHMLERKSGHLVITSSFSGRQATPLSATYAASKFALHGFFDSLRAELGSSGIRVTMVCPGPVVSEIGAHALINNAGASYNIQSSQKRMPTERCAALMASGVASGINELWICQQPLLSLYYCNEYCRETFTRLMCFLGPYRVKVFKQGGDDYDVGGLIKLAIKDKKEAKANKS